jgi:hypothetical protein
MSLYSVGVRVDTGVVILKNSYKSTFGGVGVKITIIPPIRVNTLGVDVDFGVVPPLYIFNSSINSIGVDVDFGVIPPKNYFKTSISTIGVDLGVADESNMIYQIEPYVQPIIYNRISENGDQMITEIDDNIRIKES